MQCLCFASFHYVHPSSQSSSCSEMFFFFFLFCPWKSQSEWQRNGINGDSTSVVWPTVGSRTAKELNRTSSSSSSSSQSPFLVVSHCCIFFCVFSSRFHDKALRESAVTLHCFGPFFFFSSFFVLFTFSVFCIFPVLFLFYFVFCSSSCSLLSLSGPAITRQWGRAILLTKLVHFISCSLFILCFFFVVLATEWSLAECK